MYKTSPSISESELSSSKTKHLLFLPTTHNVDPFFKPNYYHHFTTLPSWFLTEPYSRLINLKEQTNAHKAYLFWCTFVTSLRHKVEAPPSQSELQTILTGLTIYGRLTLFHLGSDNYCSSSGPQYFFTFPTSPHFCSQDLTYEKINTLQRYFETAVQVAITQISSNNNCIQLLMWF